MAASLGWSPQLVLAPLLRRLAPGLEIALRLYHVKPRSSYVEEKLRETLEEIERVTRYMQGVTLLGPMGLNPDQEPGRWALEIAKDLSSHVRDKGFGRLALVAAGGPRPLATVIALLGAAAAYLAPPGTVEATVVFEDDRREYPLPPVPVRSFTGEAKAEVAMILIGLGEAGYREIAEYMRSRGASRDETTVKRLLHELQRDRLVSCERRGRKTVCRPTGGLALLLAAEELAEALTRAQGRDVA